MARLPETLLPPSSLQYIPIPDGSDLSHLVHSILSLPAAQAAQTIPLLPDNHTLLLFPGSGAALFCPPHSTPLSIPLEAGCPLYAVRLHCGCGDWIQNADFSATNGHVLPLEPLLPGSDRLGQVLALCTSLPEKNTRFMRFAALHGGRSYQSSPLLRQCLSLIAERNGQVRISELAEHTGCSERHLNRLMHQKVGLSTKTVCQLTQLHHSLQVIWTSPSRSLLHLAVNCGYFDQAHMNRQYRQFLCCSAGDMRRLLEEHHSS